MLKADQLHLQAYGRTDRGLERKRNEDNLFTNDLLNIYAVADGLGGLPSGALASSIAIKFLEKIVKDPTFTGDLDIKKTFDQINRLVFDEGTKINPELGIGTTLTIAQVVQNNSIHVGHVGDSGIFLFSPDGNWKKLTTDHTMEQEMKNHRKPGQTLQLPEYYSHTLTRCIGHMDTIHIHYSHHVFVPGDRILLFTDGISKVLEREELQAKIFEARTPQAFIDDIIETVNKRGGPDNATGIALFTK